MILLKKEKYHTIRELFKTVEFNISFVYAVIDNYVTGKVYVDTIENPKTIYVLHPYGMSLLFGECNNEKFNTAFLKYALNTDKLRNNYEWMQAYPNNWHATLEELFKDRTIKSSESEDNTDSKMIELHTRVNFKFNINMYLEFKKTYIVEDYHIVRTDKQLFYDMQGSVIPLLFWNSAEDFVNKGVGFSLLSNEKLASTAYSACIDESKLEIGIETIEEFRSRGFAKYICSSIIDYCIENNLEPIWSCRKENIGSFRLAQKLGFEPTLELPFYRLPS